MTTIRPSSVPPRIISNSNAFTAHVSPEMMRQLKLSPGQTFLICEDNGEPKTFKRAAVDAMRGASREPIRIQSRASRKSSELHVWISNDPTYFEELRKKQGKEQRQQHE